MTIPSSVTEIGYWSLAANSNISITCESTTPPKTRGSIFYSNYNGIIYVPAQSVDAYKAADGWSTYASNIQPIPQG